MSRPSRGTRADYRWFTPLQTRWMDNDLYGHVNNVVYYSYFDTAIGHYLMQACDFDPYSSPIIDFAVDTGCRFHSSLAFPDTVHAGLRVGHVGTSSCRWELGLFRNDEDMAAAEGHFVHVFVDRATQRPVPIPAFVRAGLERLFVSPR
jgi:acyl-CoA thioester hydrolase